jgi:hypothetical protein
MKKVLAIFLFVFCLTGVFAQRKVQASPAFLSEAFFDFLIDHLQGQLWENPDTSFMKQSNWTTYWSSLDNEALYTVYFTGMSGTIINTQGIVYLPANFNNGRISQTFELAQKCAGKYAKVVPIKTDEGLLYKTNNKKEAPLVISEKVQLYLSLKNIAAENGESHPCIEFFITTEP